MLRDDVDRAFGEWMKATPLGLGALTEGPQEADVELMARVIAFRDVMLMAADEIERVMPEPSP